MSSLNVVHNKRDLEFVIKLSDKDEAYLKYQHLDETSIELLHAFVPEKFRGRQLGKLLVKAAVEYGVENNFKMKPTCTYVIKYINEDKDNYDNYQHLIMTS